MLLHVWLTLGDVAPNIPAPDILRQQVPGPWAIGIATGCVLAGLAVIALLLRARQRLMPMTRLSLAGLAFLTVALAGIGLVYHQQHQSAVKEAREGWEREKREAYRRSDHRLPIPATSPDETPAQDPGVGTSDQESR